LAELGRIPDAGQEKPEAAGPQVLQSTPKMMKHVVADHDTQSAEESDGRNPTDNPTLGDVIAARFGRRDLVKGALGVAAIAATVSPLALAAATEANAQAAASRFVFKELEAGSDPDHHVAEGYDADILIRWGDPVLPDAPAFDPRAQTAAAQ